MTVRQNHDQLMRELSSRAATHRAVPTTSGYRQRYDKDDDFTEAVLHVMKPDPSDDLREILDADGFKRIEDQGFFDALENQGCFTCVEASAVRIQDPAVEFVDIARRGNTNSTQSWDHADRVEHIEDIDDIFAKGMPPTRFTRKAVGFC